jgi:hypothetical protein
MRFAAISDEIRQNQKAIDNLKMDMAEILQAPPRPLIMAA